VPEIDGKPVFDGGVAAEITDVADDVAGADPAVLEAVTTTRSVPPTLLDPAI
jgi:hypothetical protein